MGEERRRWWVSEIKDHWLCGGSLFHGVNGDVTRNLDDAMKFSYALDAQSHNGKHYRGGTPVEVEKKEVWFLVPKKDKWEVAITNRRTGDMLSLCIIDAGIGDTVSYTIHAGDFDKSDEYGGYVKVQY